MITKKETFVFLFLILSLILGIISFIGNLHHYFYATQENGVNVKGIVTGYSNGGRWAKFFVKWYDLEGKEHYTQNLNYTILPNVGDSVDVIYFKNDKNNGVINTTAELRGGLKSIGLKLLIIFIINFCFIYYLIKNGKIGLISKKSNSKL